jgi:hypothetical protein
MLPCRPVGFNLMNSKSKITIELSFHGAGDGNRTRMTSLEGWSSTIELRPQRRHKAPPSPGSVPSPARPHIQAGRIAVARAAAVTRARAFRPDQECAGSATLPR